MCKVVIVSAFGVKHHLVGQLTEEEAYNFCVEHNWRWLDENEFEWSLEIEDDYDEWR